MIQHLLPTGRPAGYNPAKRQIENLRYSRQIECRELEVGAGLSMDNAASLRLKETCARPKKKAQLPRAAVAVNLRPMKSLAHFASRRLFSYAAIALFACVNLAISAAGPAETLFVATALTDEGGFTEGIEGPACDARGNIYAVNFARQQTIGKVTPDGKATVYVELPGKSVGNGIRFAPDGIMFVADYVGHNVLRIDPATRAITVFAHSDQMNQPNDLAIASDGTLYASDPDWKEKTGQLWRIDKDGSVKRIAEKLGTSNGIEVSPDGKTLYVNESVQRNVWVFTIGAEGNLTDKRLLKKFDDHGFDGMRCDIDGNLYITRHGKGTVVKLSPTGEVLREIDVLGPMPSNICFGGPDGRTAYVTEVKQRRLVQFRVDRPGLEWNRWAGK